MKMIMLYFLIFNLIALPSYAMISPKVQLPKIKFSKEFAGVFPSSQLSGYITLYKSANGPVKVFVSSAYLQRANSKKLHSGWQAILPEKSDLVYSSCSKTAGLILECRAIVKEKNKYVVKMIVVTPSGGQSILHTDSLPDAETARKLLKQISIKS